MRENRIVHQVTLKYLMRNRRRSLISLISISLMVILLTGVFIGKDTAIRFFTDIAEAQRGKWHINVYDVNEEQYEKLKALPFVEETGISSHLAVSEFSESASEYKPYLDLRAYSRNSLDWMNITVTEGRMPENDQEVILSSALKEDGSSVSIGETVSIKGVRRIITNSCDHKKIFPFQEIVMEPWETMEVPYDFPYYPDNPEITETVEPDGFEKEYTVTGFMEVPMYESTSSAVYTAITYSEAIPAGSLFNLSMRVSDEYGDLYSSINEIAPDQFEANNYVLIFHGQSTSYTLNLVAVMMQAFLTVLIIVIAVVLMNNVFALSYDERLKYLGMLTSIGATARQKRSSVYFEAGLLTAIALPIGFVSGLLIIKAAVSLMDDAAALFMGLNLTKTVPVTLVLKPESVLAVILCSFLTVFVSAFLPAHKMSKIGPVASIRGNENEKKTKAKKTKSYQSAEMMLAAGFLKRERRRSSAIVKALCAFMTVMTVLTYASGALISMVGFKLRDTDGAISKSFRSHEYLLYTVNDAALFDSLKEQLERTGGIEYGEVMYDFSTIAIADETYYSDEFKDAYRDVIMQYYPEGLSEEEYQEHVKERALFADFVAVDDAKFDEIMKSLHAVSPETEKPRVILVKDGAVSTDYYGVWQRSASDYRYYEVSDMTGCQPGDVFAAEFGLEKVEFTVAAKADRKQLSEWFSFSGEKLSGILPLTDAQQLIAMDACSGADRIYLFDGDETNQSFSRTLTEIRSAQSDDFMLTSHDTYLPETIQTSLKKLIRIILIIFTALASAVCFMNIFNSISGLIACRRKTFAILKAVGMTDVQLRNALLKEAGIICFKSIVYAAVISAALCFAVKKIVSTAFGDFAIAIPVSAIVLSVIASVTMCIVSGWYSYRREQNTNLTEEIRKDSI